MEFADGKRKFFTLPSDLLDGEDCPLTNFDKVKVGQNYPAKWENRYYEATITKVCSD